MQEIWKAIKGYEKSYLISNLGNVKSLKRFKVIKDRILKLNPDSSGYYQIRLSRDGIGKMMRVHTLVAQEFLNYKPDGTNKLVCNHINFDKTDNRLINIEIITNRENCNKKHLKSSSKYTGAYWSKKNMKWRSQIQINGVVKHLGYFKTDFAASEAYQTALKNL